MSGPKLPSPIDKITNTDDLITPPWYQYFLGQDHGWRKRVDMVSTDSTASAILQDRITVFNSTAGVVHTLERPSIGSRTVLICNTSSTQNGSITVAAATDVAIGPSGENALVFGTSASSYEFVELLGTSTAQYHILQRTTNISVAASS